MRGGGMAGLAPDPVPERTDYSRSKSLPPNRNEGKGPRGVGRRSRGGGRDTDKGRSERSNGAAKNGKGGNNRRAECEKSRSDWGAKDVWGEAAAGAPGMEEQRGRKSSTQRRDPAVHIAGYPMDTSEEELCGFIRYMMPPGHTFSIKKIEGQHPTSGNILNYTWLNTISQDTCATAVQVLNGADFLGSRLKAQFRNDRNDRNKKQENSPGSWGTVQGKKGNKDNDSKPEQAWPDHEHECAPGQPPSDASSQSSGWNSATQGRRSGNIIPGNIPVSRPIPSFSNFNTAQHPPPPPTIPNFSNFAPPSLNNGGFPPPLVQKNLPPPNNAAFPPPLMNVLPESGKGGFPPPPPNGVFPPIPVDPRLAAAFSPQRPPPLISDTHCAARSSPTALSTSSDPLLTTSGHSDALLSASGAPLDPPSVPPLDSKLPQDSKGAQSKDAPATRAPSPTPSTTSTVSKRSSAPLPASKSSARPASPTLSIASTTVSRRTVGASGRPPSPTLSIASTSVSRRTVGAPGRPPSPTLSIASTTRRSGGASVAPKSTSGSPHNTSASSATNKSPQVPSRKSSTRRIPLLELPLNTPFFGMWCCGDSALDFHVQPVESAPTIEQLIEEISALYGAQPVDPTYSPKEGDLVAALWPTQDLETWYRCEVIYASGDTALVRYVDYGGKERISFGDLRKLISHVHHPNQAVKCRLEGVLLPTEYQEQEMAFFKTKMAQSGAQLKINPISVSDDVYTVSITLPSGEDLATLLREAEFAEPAPEMRYVPGDERRVETGSGDFVGISHFESLEKFYVVFVEDCERRKSMCNSLSSLIRSSQASSSELIEEGCLVAAQYQNEIWRARVTDSSTSASTLEVQFLDFGDCASLPRSDVRLLPEEFAQEPAFAVRCHIDAIPVNAARIREFIVSEYPDTARVFCRFLRRSPSHGYQVEISRPESNGLGLRAQLERLGMVETARTAPSQRLNGAPPSTHSVEEEESGPPLRLVNDHTYTLPLNMALTCGEIQVNSPSSIYVRFRAKTQVNAKEMENRVRERGRDPSVPSFSDIPGRKPRQTELVIWCDEEGTWQRGIVLEPNGRVFGPDRGSTRLAPLDQMKPGDPTDSDFLETPRLAFRAVFEGAQEVLEQLPLNEELQALFKGTKSCSVTSQEGDTVSIKCSAVVSGAKKLLNPSPTKLKVQTVSEARAQAVVEERLRSLEEEVKRLRSLEEEVKGLRSLEEEMKGLKQTNEQLKLANEQLELDVQQIKQMLRKALNLKT